IETMLTRWRQLQKEKHPQCQPINFDEIMETDLARQLQQLPLDQHVYKKIRHRLFNFMREQRQYKEKKQESFKKNRRFHLSYIYDNVGPKGRFNKKLREILSKHIQLQNTTFENNKLQLDITTKSQHSLISLLSGQRPSHPILNLK
ncbi:unnamed protein product, partial [Rotaria sp. Silwood1]